MRTYFWAAWLAPSTDVSVPSSTAPGASPRRAAVIAVAVAIIAVVAGAAVYVVYLAPKNGPSPSPPGPTGPAQISVIPSPNTRSDCIQGIPFEPRPTKPLAYGTLQANTYNVPSGTQGHVGMCYDASAGTMLGYANWSVVGSPGGWFSYPQIAYGVNYYLGDATNYTNQSAHWKLPQTTTATIDESLWVTATYDFHPPDSASVDGYDLSLDNFFSEGLPPTIEMGPFVEVEIFLAHHITYPFQYAPWSTPTLVNGTLAPTRWDVGYWCHGTDNGTDPSISFDFSFLGQSSNGLNEATVGLNLSAFLVQVKSMLPSASCWSSPPSLFPQMYLGEQDLGSEDGAVAGASYSYNWTISNYCLHTLVRTPQASNVTCSTALATRAGLIRSAAGDALQGPQPSALRVQHELDRFGRSL